MSTSDPADGPRPNGPRSRKGARTRARLLEAAKQIFEEHGFLEARISDIAERAGLSHGSFYHYFDSKEEIFREVAEAADERLAAPMGVILARGSTATPPERLREAIGGFLESYRDDARILGVIEQVARYDEPVNAVLRARHKLQNEQVADSIRLLQRRGMADPGLDPQIAAAALGAMTTRFAEMLLSQGFVHCSFDDAVEQITRLFVNALGIKDEAEAPRRRRVASR